MSKYRILILGAGFSCPAGLPTATELWQVILEKAKTFSGRAAKFHEDLEAYINYRRECDGDEIAADKVDFENFMKFLDIEHYLGVRGSDTWSEDGNEGTIVTKTLIGKILAQKINRLTKIPDLYLEFARRLEPNDIVITFNYDTLLENALDGVGKPYRLFLDRYKRVDEYLSVIPEDRGEVILLKVHGSIDWFDRSFFERLEVRHAELKASPPEDIIFSNEAELGLVPLVDGPRNDDDPLKSVYRAKNLRALYSRDLMFLATPKMLPPSASKIVYSTKMHDFWSGIGKAGPLNFGMSIIGFSLPTHDDYVRQIIYSMVTQYQSTNWGKEVLDMTKTPLVIVDFFKNSDAEEIFRKRYRFVDWGKAVLVRSGFNTEALDIIFK